MPRSSETPISITNRAYGAGFEGGRLKFGRPIALSLAIALILLPGAARSGTVSLNGVSFSDELGGFILERVTGQGSIVDPFVVVERMINVEGATLVFRADPSFGNRIGSPDRIGFALVKVIKNATGHEWSSLEVELESKLGIPSDHTDELSFGQGSTAGRPFTASAFAHITLIDEPFDRIEYDDGNIPAGGQVSLRFVVSQPGSLHEAFVVQRPGRPVAERTSFPAEWHMASGRAAAGPPGGSLAGRSIRAEGLDQRPQVSLKAPPAADGSAINPLAHLIEACRLQGPVGFVEGQTSFVPR